MKLNRFIAIVLCLFAFEVVEAKDSDPCEDALSLASAQKRQDETLHEAAMIWGLLEKFWAEKLGREVPVSKLVVYTEMTASGCGLIFASMGPLYCPEDRNAYIDFRWYSELSTKFKAPGAGGRVYTLAHEYAHHIQNVLGTLKPVYDLAALHDGDRPWIASHIYTSNELWADAMAGFFTGHLFATGRMDKDEVTEGAAAAARLGDDYVYALLNGGRKMPVNHCIKHGTGTQRQEWFMRGFRSRAANELNPFLDAKINERFSGALLKDLQAPFNAQTLRAPF